MRKTIKNLLPLGCCAVLLGAYSASASAATVSGNLASDSSVEYFPLDLTSGGTVSAFTTSYAGGMNLDGSTTAAGGFLPVLTLWSSKGAIDSTNGTGDASLTDTLAAGKYELTLTEFPNSANPTVMDPHDPMAFGVFGDPSATRAGSCASGNAFTDCISGAQETSAFTVNITTPTGGPGGPPAVPEPATLALTAGALVAAGFWRRRKQVSDR